MVAVVALVYTAPAGAPLTTFTKELPLKYCHWYVKGPVPFGTTVKDAIPDVEHMMLLPGCVSIVTGVQVEITFTVTVKGDPIHPAKDVGVTK